MMKLKIIEIKSINPELKQSEITKELEGSISTLKRYLNDVNVLSPYRVPPNNTNERK